MEFNKANGKLTITIDISGKGTLSKSKKTILVASTNGFIPVPNTNMRLGLNLIKPKTETKQPKAS